MWFTCTLFDVHTVSRSCLTYLWTRGSSRLSISHIRISSSLFAEWYFPRSCMFMAALSDINRPYVTLSYDMYFRCIFICIYVCRPVIIRSFFVYRITVTVSLHAGALTFTVLWNYRRHCDESRQSTVEVQRSWWTSSNWGFSWRSENKKYHPDLPITLGSANNKNKTCKNIFLLNLFENV